MRLKIVSPPFFLSATSVHQATTTMAPATVYVRFCVSLSTNFSCLSTDWDKYITLCGVRLRKVDTVYSIESCSQVQYLGYCRDGCRVTKDKIGMEAFAYLTQTYPNDVDNTEISVSIARSKEDMIPVGAIITFIPADIHNSTFANTWPDTLKLGSVKAEKRVALPQVATYTVYCPDGTDICVGDIHKAASAHAKRLQPISTKTSVNFYTDQKSEILQTVLKLHEIRME